MYQLHVGDTVPFPIEPPRGSAVKGRYDNIIEQLERKYCGSRTAAVVDDMEDSPKKKSRQKRAASIVNEGADGEEEEDGRSNDDYYDSEDSFIDDSAADRDIQFAFNMRNVQTKRSGFFVSAGELEVTAPAKSSKSMAVQEIDFDPDAVDAEPERNQKSPSKSSQSAMQAIRKLIRRRMIELSPKRFPSEIAAEIGRAVELCRRSSDYRWAIRELTDILQPTHLSSGRIKKHIQESAAGARMKEDIKKKKGEGKMEQSVELIIAMLEVKVKLFVVEGSDIEASSFINRAMAATTESLSSEDVLASVDALADAYMKIWASLWENFELRSTLQNFQDVCKKWAISEALDRISKKAVMKAAAEPGPDAAAAGAEDGHVSAQPPLLDLTKVCFILLSLYYCIVC